MKPNSMPHRLVAGIAIGLILLKSVLTALVAFALGTGRFLTIAAIPLDLFLCYFLWVGKRWAPSLLAIRLFLGLLMVTFVGYRYGLFLVAAADAIITFAILAMLLGRPSSKRAYAALTVSVVTLVAIGGLMSLHLYRHYRLDRVLSRSKQVAVYRGTHEYEVGFSKLPWRVVAPAAGQELLGDQVKVADLILVREDGNAFGLFFPLKLPNVPFSEAFASRLQHELQRTLLSNLRNWKSYLSDDGLFLTADGPDEEMPLTYVVLYKHFEGLGVYAVLWADRAHRTDLLRDANALYDQLSAKPLKQRLPRYTPSEVYRNNTPAIVQVVIYDEKDNPVARGSGFNLAPQGLVMTSRHLLTSGSRVGILFPELEPFDEAKIVALGSRDLDMALLSVDGRNLPRVQGLRSVEVTPGDAVIVIGHPKGLSHTVSEGIVSGIRNGETVTYYQISAPMSSGSSGGPVFNAYGEVIGIATSVVRDAQNLNFSISVDSIAQMRRLPEPMTLADLRQAVKKKDE